MNNFEARIESDSSRLGPIMRAFPLYRIARREGLHMRHSLILTAFILAGGAYGQTDVSMVCPPRATGVQRPGGSEVASRLRLLYPSARFTVVDRRGSGIAVLL